MNKIKINLLSHGRFHMVDLTRELKKRGFDVKLYSFVPPKMCKKYGLCNEDFYSLFYILAPLVYISRHFKSFDKIRNIIQDVIMAIIMRKCNILISLTGFIFAPKKAKRNGATIIFERGSKHILEQEKILKHIHNRKEIEVIPSFNIKRNLEAYNIADYISIASQHVKESFIKNNFNPNKLFINPYGVDLSMFKPTLKKNKPYDVIMVGGWSYRKGCDLIIEAMKQMKLKFLHVGSIVDIPFPTNIPHFTHIDAVDQSKLINYYHQAKIFLFPSREDGFGMVLSQAMACNLPIVGSPNSGAPDLKEMIAIQDCITIIQDYTIDSIINAVNQALQQYDKLYEVYAGEAVNNLTWEAYGNRYANFINKIISDKTQHLL